MKLMEQRKFVFFIAALLFGIQYSFAQDVIYKQSGDSVIAKVKEIRQTTIVYKRYDNQEGPDYVIMINTVARIVFQNGTVEVFTNASEPVTATKVKAEELQKKPNILPVVYGKNIISFIPVHIIQTIPYGFGIQYERFLGKSQLLSVRVPLSVSFVNSDDRENYSGDHSRRTGQMFWTYPGVKVYLVKDKRKCSLAVGSNLAFGVGSIPVTRYNGYNYNTGKSSYDYAWDNKFVVGMMVGGSLNFQPLPKLYIGIDLGLGYSFNDNEEGSSPSSSVYNNGYTGTYSNTNYINVPLIQLALGMGYRF